MKSATYGPFLEGLKTYLSGPPSFFHVPLQPEFSKPGTAPVTEFVTWYFPPTYDTADWDTTFRTFVQVVNETAAGFHGVSYGWVEEELEHPGLADVGGKGKAFSAAFGWDSVDAHMAYRETDSFKEAIEALRSKGIKGVNMVSSAFWNPVTFSSPLRLLTLGSVMCRSKPSNRASTERIIHLAVAQIDTRFTLSLSNQRNTIGLITINQARPN